MMSYPRNAESIPAIEPRKVQILDCTIRDGGYVVDFQFTKEDTFVVAKGLAQAGIRHIEVGHGLGLNAGATKGRAAESDRDYIVAAHRAVNGCAKIGCFFIPGIGNKDDIRAASDAGLGFIRLGIDVDDFAKLEPFVSLAKSLGLEVWANMMKSYIVSPAEFGRIAKRVGDFGADVVALVDSSGGMTPDDVANYTAATLKQTQIPLAFHGHDNLSLAIANCLRFVEEGGSYVDGSLSGLGRSGGNAATELLAALLSRRNILERPVDWERLIEFSDSVMQFCTPGQRRPRAAEIATGLNFFHSSFSHLVDDAVHNTGASLFRTILRLPEASRKTVRREVAQQAAEEALATQAESFIWGDNADRFERTQPANVEELVGRLRVDSGKFPQPRVVTVAYSPSLGLTKIGPLRRNATSVVAHIEVSDLVSYNEVRSELEGVCDLWLVDDELARNLTLEQRRHCFVYDDNRVISNALADAVQILGLEKLALIGDDSGNITSNSKFLVLNAFDETVDAILACSAKTPVGPEVIAVVRDQCVVLITEPGALSAAGFKAARDRGLAIWRLDCGAALVAEAERILNTYERFKSRAGVETLPNGRKIVAGGVVGDVGDIVVDNCIKPRFILGEADGRGGIRAVNNDSAKVIQDWIMEKWNL